MHVGVRMIVDVRRALRATVRGRQSIILSTQNSWVCIHKFEYQECIPHLLQETHTYAI
jgi:hypothetical protein